MRYISYQAIQKSMQEHKAFKFSCSLSILEQPCDSVRTNVIMGKHAIYRLVSRDLTLPQRQTDISGNVSLEAVKVTGE